jgi:hypothetical protein
VNIEDLESFLRFTKDWIAKNDYEYYEHAKDTRPSKSKNFYSERF